MDIVSSASTAKRPGGVGLTIREEILYVVRSCGRIRLSSLVILLWSEFPDAGSEVMANALLGLRSSGLVVLEDGSPLGCALGAPSETTVRCPRPEEVH